MNETGVLGDRQYVTDGGLETDLIFHRGVDIPDDYVDIADRAGVGLLLETPTWARLTESSTF